MKKLMMVVAIAALSVNGAFAEAPDEEEYGERVWFLADGDFSRGNYLDYFQRPFAGTLKRNQEGYKGYACEVTFGETRPMKVEPGKTYALSFKMFNKGGNNNTTNRTLRAAMPSGVSFLKGGEEYPDAWKSVGGIGWRNVKEKYPEYLMDNPGAKWVDVKRTFTVPRGSEMVTFSFGYSRNSDWGPFLVAEMKLEEVK